MRDVRPAAAAATATAGGDVDEFFAALGDAWRLRGAQRARLVPAVKAALEMGWAAQDLASVTGANTTGVRNPYAVLAARLAPAELPVPPSRPARPQWCGECDQVTRMLDYHGDAPRPCPNCKPLRPRQLLTNGGRSQFSRTKPAWGPVGGTGRITVQQNSPR